MRTITVTVYNTQATLNVLNEVVSVQVNLTETKVPLNVYYGISEQQVLELLEKENIYGLKKTDNPEFADSLITPLAAEATYTPSVWAYLIGLFTTVPKSVKDHIVKIWSRVQLLEDNSYLQSFVIPTKFLKQYDYFNAARVSASSVTTGVPLQDAIMLIPFCVTDEVTIDLARMRVSTLYSGGKMRIGIYEGYPFYPYTSVFRSNELTQDIAGVKDTTASITLAKGKMYWFAFITNNVTVRMFSYQIYQLAPIKGNDAISSNIHSILFANYPYGALPENLEGLTLNAMYTYFPVISLRKA